MTTKHTPGPWIATKPGEGPTRSSSYAVRQENGLILAAVLSNKQIADARLIAAAPDMLEALKKLCDIGQAGVIERRETGKPTYYALEEVARISREAIQKAQGDR